ncbi:hypothetical protein [Calothrix sp. NIES-3974]|uniref:hypothetical protein n=1 Tax=Calothrix sp. NIES-3974 TaxID=2005462 RepID=UPI000BBCD7A2|nr:hypothetical protein [Calothrix sp. NIES-3974]
MNGFGILDFGLNPVETTRRVVSGNNPSGRLLNFDRYLVAQFLFESGRYKTNRTYAKKICPQRPECSFGKQSQDFRNYFVLHTLRGASYVGNDAVALLLRQP